MLRVEVGAFRNRKMLLAHVGVLNISITLKTVHFAARSRLLDCLEKLDISVGWGPRGANSWGLEVT